MTMEKTRQDLMTALSNCIEQSPDKVLKQLKDAMAAYKAERPRDFNRILERSRVLVDLWSTMEEAIEIGYDMPRAIEKENLMEHLPTELAVGDKIEITAQGRCLRGVVRVIANRPFADGTHDKWNYWDVEYDIEKPLPGHGSYGRWKQSQDGGDLKLLERSHAEAQKG
jgi:hypothetical protein